MPLFLFSKLYRVSGKIEFAKPLPFATRLFAAAKITVQKLDSNLSRVDVLFCLLAGEDELVNSKFAGAVYISQDNFKNTREQFVEIYDDEDGIVDYLNGLATAKYFKRPIGKINKENTEKYINNLVGKKMMDILSFT